MAVDTPPYVMTEKHEEHVTDKDDADDSTIDSLVFNEIYDDSTLNMICSINEEHPILFCENQRRQHPWQFGRFDLAELW